MGTKRTAIENNKFAQAFRTLTNQIEADLAALYMHASRAYGTPGTTPFGIAGDFTDAAQVVRILKDNGAPTSDIQLVINTAAGTNIIGKQARADIIGASVATLQQQGVLLDIAGAKIRESAQIRNVVKGTGAAYQINNAAGYAAGATALALDTGSGPVNAGDVVTFNGDLNKYVVGAALSGGNMALNAPGLVQALTDDAVMTIGDSYAANMCFDRSAIHLLARLPKVPEGGDQADDEMIMIDPVSGLPFRVALYRGYMANQFAIQMAWGVKAVKPAHISLLLG
ncbi:P22 phage major capsid protein family protein [Desulfobulbus sp.]|uniref:P22 phage major capsid protein family protein n=1 Tax=Desulfobulbus sp. TaxID=895 RepID=UPI00286F396B|nr:P22 phage major capsid protein family protein [Desulfobulbus sp.]